jgi:hypothetical protein
MGLGSGIQDPEKNLFQIPDPGVKNLDATFCTILCQLLKAFAILKKFSFYVWPGSNIMYIRSTVDLEPE